MSQQFVILRHTEGAGVHYDFMLQTGEVLATWRVGVNPADLSADEEAEATKLADHRLAYLDYEGPISGDRGSVHRVDRGPFERQSDQSGRTRIELSGRTIQGAFELVPLGQGLERWRLVRLGR